MENEELQIGIPKKGDKAFISNESYNYNYSSLNRSKGINNEHSQFLIIEGYREASKELLENLLLDEEIDWLKLDSKIFPVLFLFRHYVEIIIKDTLRYYNILNDLIASNEVGFVKEHSLMKLWSCLKPFLERNYLTYEKKLAEECMASDNSIEALIKEIDELDKFSFAFRYAFEGAKTIDTKVNYTISKPVIINLKNLKNIIIKMINYFEGIHSQAVWFLDEKQSN